MHTEDSNVTPENVRPSEARRALPSTDATIAPVTLSDGSVAYNVLLTVEGATFVFATPSPRYADELAKKMNGCAWIERAG